MIEKLKVVIAGDTFPPDINGAARFTQRLASGLASHGHEVHVIAPAFSEEFGTSVEVHDGQELIVHRIRSYRLPQHKTLRYVIPWGLKRQIRNLLREVKPAALHINSHLLIGRWALAAAKQTGTKIIATNHIMPENLFKYSFIPSWLEGFATRAAWKDAGRVLRKVDAVTTPTRRAADLLENSANIDGVLAISCGIDASKFANLTPTSNQSPLFLFLGRLDDEKRIHILLRAVAELTDHPNVRVELVGDGAERQNLETLAKQLGIADRVKFAGHISDADLAGAYERCTAFVMPSIAELQSIATMEAMASGRPVIGADAMALPHLVHDGDNGYLFPPDDVAALADRLRRIVEADEAELLRLSENSLHLIQAHDIERTLLIFEDLYQGLGESILTTADNDPGYLQPIGRLSDAVRETLSSWRVDAATIRSRAEHLREEAIERFSEVREEAREKISEVREEAMEKLSEVREEAREKISEVREEAIERFSEVREEVAEAAKRFKRRRSQDEE